MRRAAERRTASSSSPSPAASALFDTAKVYGTEITFKKWFAQEPEVRKQIFLVTKDMPQALRDLLNMVDERLAALGTDYIDLS